MEATEGQQDVAKEGYMTRMKVFNVYYDIFKVFILFASHFATHHVDNIVSLVLNSISLIIL